MFAEDLSAFFDVDAGFAVNATIGAATVPVIFDNGYQSALGGMIESSGPVCQAKRADVTTVVQGTLITIAAVAYTVVSVQPDGTGVTTLQLRG